MFSYFILLNNYGTSVNKNNVTLAVPRTFILVKPSERPLGLSIVQFNEISQIHSSAYTNVWQGLEDHQTSRYPQGQVE